MSATIDLGKIKITWRGTYNASTAYAVDDAVYYSGNSYINKQAGTGQTPSGSSSYWDVMAQGSDLGSISGLAQGDIFYYNGSAFARLAAGTNGHFLKTQGSSANPVWAAGGGNLVQTAVGYKTDVFSSTTTSSWYDITGIALTLSSVGSNSHKAIGNFGFAWGTHTSDTVNAFRIRKTIDGGSNWTVLPNHVHGGTGGGAANFQSQTVGLRSMLDSNGGNYTNLPFYDTAIGTTGNVTYQMQGYRVQSGTFYINRTSSDSTTYGRGSANFWVMEVKA